MSAWADRAQPPPALRLKGMPARERLKRFWGRVEEKLGIEPLQRVPSNFRDQPLRRELREDSIYITRE